MAGPDLNYAYVTVLNSVPGRGGHFGSLRTRAALNSTREREGGEGVRLLLTWRYSIRRPFVTALENPRSSIVTCFLDELVDVGDNEIRRRGGDGVRFADWLDWKIVHIFMVYIFWNGGCY